MIRNFYIKYILPNIPWWLKAFLQIFRYYQHFIFGNRKRAHDFFPIGFNGDLLIGKIFNIENSGDNYCALYYKENCVPSFFINPYDSLSFKTEILKDARIVQKGTYLSVESGDILPLAIINKVKNTIQSNAYSAKIKFKQSGKEYFLQNLAQNRFHYLPIPVNDQIEIISNHEIICAKVIKKSSSATKKKLILNLFIDGLAQKVLNKYGIENLMPHTYKYFSNGVIFENVWSCGQWTFPSVASLTSGIYPIRHKVFNPDIEQFIPKDIKVMPEYFKESGYFTFQVCGNQRKSPAHGYLRGFDRTVYRANMPAVDILDCTLEQLKAFKSQNMFGWVTFFDLHHVIYNIADLESQLDSSIELHDYYKDSKGKSVNSSYHEPSIVRYINEIKALDERLNVLFNFLKENYSENEVLVSLCSDHGQSYLEADKHPLTESRISVPLMINVGSLGKNNQLLESVDLLPSLLKLSGIDFNENNLDGKYPSALGGEASRDYAISEAIYPNQKYALVITNNKNRFEYLSKEKIDSSGKISKNFETLKLIDRINGNEVFDSELLDYYKKLSIGHIEKQRL